MRIKSPTSISPPAPPQAPPAPTAPPVAVAPPPPPPAPVQPVAPPLPQAQPAPQALAVQPAAGELALPSYVEANPEGFEHAKPDGLFLPMLIVAQGMSPEVMQGKVPMGSVALSSNKEEVIFARDTKVPFFIFFHHRQWTQWGNRETNEGMIAQSYDPDGELARSAMRRETVTYKTKEGDKTVQKVSMSHRFFIVFESDEPGKLFTDPVCLVLGRSKVKVARNLIQLAQKRANAPIYAGKYNLWSYLEHNKKNNKDYFNFDVENNGWATKEQYDLLKDLYARTAATYKAISTSMADDDDAPDGDEVITAEVIQAKSTSY